MIDALTLLPLAALPILVIVGGLHDLTTMTIPNWVSGLLALLFLPAALAAGLSPADVGLHLAVGIAALFAGMALFALNWIGGGDAKLMAAACLWLGLADSGVFVLWTGVAGGLFCLMLMLARGAAQPYVAAAPAWVGRLMAPRGDIPYGVAIAVGALMTYPTSPLAARFAIGV